MKRTTIAIALILAAACTSAQDKLYHNTFNLNQVELLDGPFKHAMDLNVKVLLEYDTDRLLAPFLHEAGLPKKAEYFPTGPAWTDMWADTTYRPWPYTTPPPATRSAMTVWYI